MESILNCLWEKFGSKDSTIEYLEWDRTNGLEIKKAVLNSVPLGQKIVIKLD